MGAAAAYRGKNPLMVTPCIRCGRLTSNLSKVCLKCLNWGWITWKQIFGNVKPIPPSRQKSV